MKSGKTKNKIILGLAVIAGILVIMIIANFESELVMQLEDPPDGTRKLFTVGSDLVCVSPNSALYIWDWKNLSVKPEKTQVAAFDVTWMIGKKLVWVPISDLNKILITDISGLKTNSEILLDYGWQGKILRTSRNGKFTVIGLTDKTIGKDNKDSYKHIRLGVIDSEFKGIAEAVTIDAKSDNFVLSNVAISEDGKFVAVTGKNNGGWVAVADVVEKKLLWEKVLEQTEEVGEVTFSPDGKKLYVDGFGETIYAFAAITGNMEQKWVMVKQADFEVQQKGVTAINVSPNSNLVIATGAYMPVYIWNAITGKLVDTRSHSQWTIGDIAFSPDGSLYTTSSIAVKASLKVWKMPSIH